VTIEATVEYLHEVAATGHEKPQLPAYQDAASFIAGLVFATQVVEYSVIRANQLVAQEALTTTTHAAIHETFLYEEARKVSIADSVGHALVQGLRGLPAAVERVEKIKVELPPDAPLN